MSQPLFAVSEEVFERHPGYVVGYVVADIDSNGGPCPRINDLLRDAEERARIMYAGKDLKGEPAIAVWRQAFSQLGWSASKYPSSVEALVKRAVRGIALPDLNPVVNLVNAAALTYLVPAGCHERNVSTTLTVRPASRDDRFLPMGDDDAEQPDIGEIVYASAHSVRTRRWVWRQSRDSLVTNTSTRLFLPVDGFNDGTSPRVEAAINFLADVLVDQLGANVVTGIVTREQPTVTQT